MSRNGGISPRVSQSKSAAPNPNYFVPKTHDMDPHIKEARLNAQRRAASVVAAAKDEKRRQNERYGSLEEYLANRNAEDPLPNLVSTRQVTTARHAPCGVFTDTIRAFQHSRKHKGAIPAGGLDLGFIDGSRGATYNPSTTASGTTMPIWLSSPSFMSPATLRTIAALGLHQEAYSAKSLAMQTSSTNNKSGAANANLYSTHTKGTPTSVGDVAGDLQSVAQLFQTKMFPAVKPVDRDEVAALANALDAMFDALPNARGLLQSQDPSTPSTPTMGTTATTPSPSTRTHNDQRTTGDRLLRPIRDRLQLTEDGTLTRPEGGFGGGAASPGGATALDDDAVMKAQWEATHVLMLGWMEVIRQTYGQVAERGVLLEKIRLCFVDLLLNAYDAADHYRQQYEDVKAMNIQDSMADLHSALVDQDKEITRLRKENSDLKERVESGRERDEEIELLRSREDALNTFITNQMTRNESILKIQEESERRLQEERGHRMKGSNSGALTFEKFAAAAEENAKRGSRRRRRNGAMNNRRRSNATGNSPGDGEGEDGVLDMYQDGTFIPAGIRRPINITRAGIAPRDLYALDKSVSYAKEWLIKLRQRFRRRERRICKRLKSMGSNEGQLDDADREALVRSIIRKTTGAALDSDPDSSSDEREEMGILSNYRGTRGGGGAGANKRKSISNFGTNTDQNDFDDDDGGDDPLQLTSRNSDDSDGRGNGSDCTVSDIEDYDDRQFTFVRDAHVQVDAEFEEGKADSVYNALQLFMKQVEGTVSASEGVVKKLYGTADVHDPSPLLRPALIKLDECKIALYDYHQRTLTHVDKEAQKDARLLSLAPQSSNRHDFTNSDAGGVDLELNATVAGMNDTKQQMGASVMARPNASPSAQPGYIRGAYIIPQGTHAQILTHLTETLEQLKKRFETLAANAQFQRALECRVPKHRTQPCDLCKRIEPDPELLRAHERFEDMKAQLQVTEEQNNNYRSEIRKLERKVAAEQAATQSKTDELVAIQKQLQELDPGTDDDDIPFTGSRSFSPKNSNTKKKGFPTSAVSASPITSPMLGSNQSTKRRKSAIEMVSEHLKAISDKIQNRKEMESQTDVTYGGAHQRHGAYHYHAEHHTKKPSSLAPINAGATPSRDRTSSFQSGSSLIATPQPAPSGSIASATALSTPKPPSRGGDVKVPVVAPRNSLGSAKQDDVAITPGLKARPVSLNVVTLEEEPRRRRVKEESKKLKEDAIGAKQRLGMVSRNADQGQLRAPHGTIKLIGAIYKSKLHADAVALSKYHQTVSKEFALLWSQRAQESGVGGGDVSSIIRSDPSAPPPCLLTAAQHTAAIHRLTSPCPEHIVEYTQTKLGAKSLVQKHTNALLSSIEEYSDVDPRIRLFGSFITEEFNKPVYFWFLHLSRHLDAAGPRFDPKNLKSAGDEGRVADVVPLDMALQCLAKMVCGIDAAGGEMEMTETPFLCTTAIPSPEDSLDNLRSLSNSGSFSSKRALEAETAAKKRNASALEWATLSVQNIQVLIKLVVAGARRNAACSRKPEAWVSVCLQPLSDQYNTLLATLHSLPMASTPSVVEHFTTLRSINFDAEVPTVSPWQLEITRADFCGIVCGWMHTYYFGTGSGGGVASSAPSSGEVFRRPLFSEEVVIADVQLPHTDAPVELPAPVGPFSPSLGVALSPRSLGAMLRTPSHRPPTALDTSSHSNGILDPARCGHRAANVAGDSNLGGGGVAGNAGYTRSVSAGPSPSPPRLSDLVGRVMSQRPATGAGGGSYGRAGYPHNTMKPPGSAPALSRVVDMVQSQHQQFGGLQSRNPISGVSPLQPFMPTGFRSGRRPTTQEHSVVGGGSPPRSRQMSIASNSIRGDTSINQSRKSSSVANSGPAAPFWQGYHPPTK